MSHTRHEEEVLARTYFVSLSCRFSGAARQNGNDIYGEIVHSPQSLVHLSIVQHSLTPSLRRGWGGFLLFATCRACAAASGFPFLCEKMTVFA